MPGSALLEVLGENNPTDAIATLEDRIPGESLACWISDGPNPQDLGTAMDQRPDRARPEALTTSPMLRLGELDPAWVLLDLHTDHLGTVRAITNSLGQMVSRHNYFPFGEEIQPDQLSYNTHQFTGHERDKETGLDYMLARYYGAELGRFMNVDPGEPALDLSSSWNRYVYSANNPIPCFDPDGEEPEYASDWLHVYALQLAFESPAIADVVREHSGPGSPYLRFASGDLGEDQYTGDSLVGKGGFIVWLPRHFLVSSRWNTCGGELTPFHF